MDEIKIPEIDQAEWVLLIIYILLIAIFILWLGVVIYSACKYRVFTRNQSNLRTEDDPPPPYPGYVPVHIELQDLRFRNSPNISSAEIDASQPSGDSHENSLTEVKHPYCSSVQANIERGISSHESAPNMAGDIEGIEPVNNATGSKLYKTQSIEDMDDDCPTGNGESAMVQDPLHHCDISESSNQTPPESDHTQNGVSDRRVTLVHAEIETTNKVDETEINLYMDDEQSCLPPEQIIDVHTYLPNQRESRHLAYPSSFERNLQSDQNEQKEEEQDALLPDHEKYCEPSFK